MDESPLRVYCTYFDSRYVPRAWAMIRSLRRVGESATVVALCFDDQALAAVASWDLGSVRAVSLAEFEEQYPQVASVRSERSASEYFFTTTPWLVEYVRTTFSPEWVTYLDADLWFVSALEPIYREIGPGACGIIPHGYPPRLKKLEKYGRYNVGWVSFRNAPGGRAVLDWWCERCLEWCFDTPEPGRYADQGYLDSFSGIVDGVVEITHPGANLAPWNLATREVTEDLGGSFLADGEPLLFYHFHGLRRKGDKYVASHIEFGARANSAVKRLYRAYVDELGVAEAVSGTAPAPPSRRGRGVRGMALQARRSLYDRVSILRGESFRIVEPTPGGFDG